MKLLFAFLATVGIACSSQAAVVLINCGADATSTNGYNALTGFKTVDNLVYNDGTTNSGYGISLTFRGTGSQVTSGQGINSALTNNSSKGINDAWSNATGSNLSDFTGSGIGYTNSSNTNDRGAQFTLTGLTAGKTYTVYLLHGCSGSGASDTTGNIVFQDITNAYNLTEINGSNGAKTGSLNYTTSYGGTLNANNLGFASGVLNYTAFMFTVNKGASTFRFKFSTSTQYAIQGIALSDDTALIPEPATATLGLLGLMGLMILRRR